jgi:hypothetical protein
MTELVVAVFLAVLFLGAVASLFYRVFLRLRQIEETFLDEILATQEMVLDVLCEEKKIARALNVAEEDSDEE